MTKCLVLLFFVFISNKLLSQTFICPSVIDIKQNELNHWLPLYKDSQELVSSIDLIKFKQHVTGFVAASWSKHYLENGHCLYQGSDQIVNQIVLAKDAFRPQPNDYWVWLQPNSTAECYGPVNECEFLP